MTHCNEHFVGGADWTKGSTICHTIAPNTTRMNEEVLGCEEVTLFWLFVLLLIKFWEEVLLGGCCRVRADMEGLGDKQD